MRISEIKALTVLFEKKVNLEARYKEYAEEIEELLKKASDSYYNTETRILTDEMYDKIYKMYLHYGGERIVGAPAKKGSRIVEVEHEYNDLVGTLGKKYNIDEVEEWILKYIKPDQSAEYVVTYKFDGNSVAESKDDKGVTKIALTRGEDGKGKDLTEYLKVINPGKGINEEIGVKYELIMTDNDLALFAKDIGKEYKNARNTVSGLLAKLDGVKYAKYITAVPLWVRNKNKHMTRAEEIEYIEEKFPNNLNSTNTWILEGTPCEIIHDLKNLYKETMDKRNELNYMIDGLVIEFLDEELRERLGYVNEKQDEPKYAVALKFPYMEQESEVVDITFSLSDKGTGIITPMCHFKPVYFNNCEQTKQSLQNYKRFKELNLSIGSPVAIQYKGDVLSYIEKIDDGIEREPFKFIENCPLCNGDVEIITNDKHEETFAKCGNPECPSKRKGHILNYCIKMSMKGIGASVIDKLYDNGVITDIASLYSIDENKASKCIGEKTTKNVIDAINSRKSIYDYELLGSLGIENFGQESAKEIFKTMNMDEFIDYYDNGTLFNKLTNIKNIGDIMAAYVINTMGYMEDTIGFLYDALDVKSYGSTIKKVDKVLTFVVTGKLTHFKDRKAIKVWLESLGHKVSGSISEKTDYLINNDITSTSGKNKFAKENNIPIITEEQVMKMME